MQSPATAANAPFQVLVPAMHLYALTDGREGAAEPEELCALARDAGIWRARYVVSVIDAARARRPR